MKIGIDGSSINPSKVGIGYYTFSLIKALQKVDKQNEYYIFTNNIENLTDLNLKDNFKLKEIKADRVNFLWIFNVSNFLKTNDFDAFLSPGNFSFGFLFNKTAQIVHDLAPIKFPQFFTRKGALEFKVLLNLCLNKSKWILTPSTSVMNEILEYEPNIKGKISALGFGAHNWVFNESTEQDRLVIKNKYNLPEKFFLSVSTLEPRKNHINTIKAFSQFYRDYPEFHYVIAGKKGWYYDEIFTEVEKSEAKDNIHFLGYVPEEDLGVLYDLSKGVIMLSFYEGIGLSALEGYVRGLPVLVSDIPIFHEVIKKSGIFKNPNSIEEILSGIKTLSLANRTTFKNSEEFKWERTANTFKALLND